MSAGYGLARGQSWVDLLSAQLDEQKYSVVVVNASVSGATSADGLNALPKLLEKYQPDILVLGLGSNDGLRGNPVLLLQNNLAKIIEMAQKDNIKVLLLGFRMPPNYGKTYTEAFSAVYSKLSKTYEVPLVPFLMSGFEQDLRYFQKDQVHPNAAAQEILLKNVWPYLTPMLQN